MEVVDRSQRVCVVGAGSSGLAAARNFIAQGFEVDVLEREDDLGGNWNFGKPGARVYRSTRMISSKSFTQYPDFKFPREYPDYPHHAQVLEYLRAYARHFEVDRRIEFNTPIERIEPAEAGWLVTTSRGETRKYRAVCICNGHNWSPKTPRYEGMFNGKMMHSAEYRTPEVLAGKRVLVVGGGNSGCDIACESSENALAAFHSTRRGYYYIPKYIFGRPADRLGDKLLRRGAPLRLRRLLFSIILRLVVGPAERYGLAKPDHKLFETHPIINTLLLYYIQHGSIKPKPDIRRLDGDFVEFTDGTRERIDLIVFATGYNIEIPFIDKDHLNWREGRPHLYANVFHPERDDLFVVGLIQPDSGQFGLVHWQSAAAALYLRAMGEGAAAAKAFAARKKGSMDLGNGIHYTNSTRHHLEVEHWSYRKALQKIAKQFEGKKRAARA